MREFVQLVMLAAPTTHFVMLAQPFCTVLGFLVWLSLSRWP
jgi:hypothetical protein